MVITKITYFLRWDYWHSSFGSLLFYCFYIFLNFHFVEHFVPHCNMATIFASNFWNLRADGLDTRAITYKKWCIHNQMNRLLMMQSSATYINWSVTCTIIFPIILLHENYTEMKVVHKNMTLYSSNWTVFWWVFFCCILSVYCHSQFQDHIFATRDSGKDLHKHTDWWLFSPWGVRILSHNPLKKEENLQFSF